MTEQTNKENRAGHATQEAGMRPDAVPQVDRRYRRKPRREPLSASSVTFSNTNGVVAIVLCILVGAAARAGSSLFLQSLIDTYILPLVGVKNPDWNPLLRALTLMACLYAAGTFCSWLWQWLIVTVEQGTLKKIRDDMFAHQQTLPIRYFDTNEHGDIMSRYTNDTDTLRQAISQSFPQMFSSAISALAALVSMLWLSVPVTIFVLVFTVILFVVVRAIVSRSGRYFVKQQIAIGDVNAFVEEAVNGQKVIKVFNHEDATQRPFDEKNEELFQASAEANTWGNVTMPIVGNMGYMLYILLAIFGGFMAISGLGNFGSPAQAAYLRRPDFAIDVVSFLRQPARPGLHAIQHGDDGARRRVAPGKADVARPKHELKGFKKVFLKAGESAEVSFDLDDRAFAYWSEKFNDWHVESGEYAIEVGTSSRDIAGSAVVELDGDGKAQPLTEWSNFMEWRKDPLGSKVLEKLRAEGEAGRMPIVPDNDMTRLFLDSMPINSMSVLMGADGKQIFEYMLAEYAELTK